MVSSKRRKKARMKTAKTQHKIAERCKNWWHHVSYQLAGQYSTFIEALNIQGMTKSAKETQAEPGKHVKAKSGWNRGILSTG